MLESAALQRHTEDAIIGSGSHHGICQHTECCVRGAPSLNRAAITGFFAPAKHLRTSTGIPLDALDAKIASTSYLQNAVCTIDRRCLPHHTHPCPPGVSTAVTDCESTAAISGHLNSIIPIDGSAKAGESTSASEHNVDRQRTW